MRGRKLCMLVVLGGTGCFAPAIRPVQMADYGHVSLSAGLQFPEANANNDDVEVSAFAAMGVAPHLQLELSGAIDSGDAAQGGIPYNWALGAGLRGGIPAGPDFQIQIAGLYEQIDASLTRTGLWGGGSTSTTRGSRETVEVGPVWTNGDRTFAAGAYLDVAMGEMTEVSSGEFAGPGLPLDVGARVAVEIRPWSEVRWLGLLAQLSFAFPVADFNGPAGNGASTFEDSSQLWTALGVAAEASF